MKRIQPTIALLTILLLAPTMLYAQQDQADTINVPLTRPGEPGSLDVSVVNGQISVKGYNGKEVKVVYRSDRTRDRDMPPATKNGLRRITTNTFGLEVTEKDNHVHVDTGIPSKNLSLEISVPRNFSLKLSSVNGDALVVNGVNGDLDMHNVSGDIRLENVSGSASANTVNGEIKAVFNRISADKPMAFSTLNGDIDLTLPGNAKYTAKIKTDQGEVYTDFQMDIDRGKESQVKATKEAGVYRAVVDKWLYGKVNGGGPEIMIKSFQGDVFIRKQAIGD